MAYYTPFLERLAEHTTVAAASLVGFDEQRVLNTLDVQIAHMRKVLDYLTLTYSVTLIGHSVGGYIAMQIRPANTRCILLFPTLSFLAQSPKGLILAPLLKYRMVPMIASWAVAIVRFMPSSILRRILRWNQSERNVEVTMQKMTPSVIYSAITLAADEMRTIRALDVVIDDKIMIYYGTTDYWVALSARSEIMKLTDAVLCNVPHSYCLDHGELMADKVLANLESRVPAK